LKVNLTLAFGILLILLALVTAMGAVSIGSFSSVTSTGRREGVGLVYSPWMEFLSVILAGAGIAFVYFSGRSQTQSPQKK
jgi:uncharacterized membrane protein